MELFDTQLDFVGSGERTLLVYTELYSNKNADNAFDEFVELAKSCSLIIVQTLQIKLNHANSKYFIGSGKVDELTSLVADNSIDLVIFCAELSPSQERNLEKDIKCRVIDRNSLILDIFAMRALSFAGKLQVELAQLKHLSTRLVRGWTHLERQKGGIGLRGPGETQLETDKRLISQRIKHLSKRLEKVQKQGDLGRKSRVKKELNMISLVGYTNAGKSSLFNCLTKSKVFTDNKLFATLDSTVRRIKLNNIGEVVIADTVGFIQNLPHDLVQAFKSTLEDTRQADLLLHVVDASDNHSADKINQVNAIIEDIEADKITTILVMNKIDCLDDFNPKIDRNKNGRIYRVWISAQYGLGIDLLNQALTENINSNISSVIVKINLNAANIRNQIYNMGCVNNEKIDEFGNWVLEISVTEHYLSKLINKQGVNLLWQQKSKQNQ